MSKNNKISLLTSIFLVCATYSAQADTIDDTYNFNNTDITGFSSVSTNDDSTAMVINPGGIGIKTEGEIFFSTSVNSKLSQTNLFGTYGSFNLGLQQFMPKGGLPPLRKYYVGTGYPIIDGFSAGVSYSNIQTTDSNAFSASSMDIGLLARPIDFLSIGLVARNITTPFIGKTQINRSYIASFGFRPGSWDRLTLTFDGEWVEGSPVNRIKGILGLETEFLNGINIKGRILSDASFKQFSWAVEAGINFPYVSFGYGRNFDNETRDSAYAKLTLNRSRTVFEQENSNLAELNFKGRISANKEYGRGIFPVELKNSVYDYLENIEKAKNDKTISGIVLNMANFSSGLAVNEELRNKLLEFKKTGKKVIAYMRSVDFKDYYLAVIADYIIMHPVGEIQLQGIGGVHYFYKDLLDKIGVEAQFERFGKYKSAVEPYIQNSASEAEKEQSNALLTDFYNSVSKAVVDSRKINNEDLKLLVNNKTIINSREAKDYKLIDEIAHYDEVGKIATKLFNTKGKYPIINIAHRSYQKYNWKDEYKVAVINAEGTITEGESTSDFFSGEGSMGADTIANLLSRARRDDNIKAVVFRIDSGGGSALASDIIAREITRYKEDKKPIVISMANVAASGGYWIATDADKIVANANTVTGSIGVFTGKMNFQKLFEKLGIKTESFKIGDHADAFSEHRPFTEDERKILSKSAQELYRLFIERVSKGRGIEINKVEELAQGHVYSGKKAKELNLIDEIGGLDKAIEIAKDLAQLKDKKVTTMNIRPSDLDNMTALAQEPAKAFYPYVLMKLVTENKVLAIMPNFDFE